MGWYEKHQAKKLQKLRKQRIAAQGRAELREKIEKERSAITKAKNTARSQSSFDTTKVKKGIGSIWGSLQQASQNYMENTSQTTKTPTAKRRRRKQKPKTTIKYITRPTKKRTRTTTKIVYITKPQKKIKRKRTTNNTPQFGFQPLKF